MTVSEPEGRGAAWTEEPRASRRGAAASWTEERSDEGRRRVESAPSASGKRASSLNGRVAIITGAGNGLGRAESRALAAAGARVVLNDLPGDAVDAVAAEIEAAGGTAVVSAGDIGEWSTGEALVGTAAARVRPARHPGQQRRPTPGPDDLLHVGAGMGPGAAGPSARALHHLAAGHRALAGAEQAGGRPGLRAHRQYLVRGVPARLLGAAQLLGGEGRHHRADRHDRAQLRPVRCPGQRDLPAGPHRDDGRADGLGAGRRGRTRWRPSTSRRWSPTWPARRPRTSTARYSWCTAAWRR